MNEQHQESDFEEVFTVTEYYDGPRQGVANLNGTPHFFDCVFSNEQDEYSDVYLLTPIQPSVLNDALENWAIFRRWELAFHTGKTTIETHPALPTEKARSEELKRGLDQALKTDGAICISRVGRFEVVGGPDLPRGVLRPMRVKWAQPSL